MAFSCCHANHCLGCSQRGHVRPLPDRRRPRCVTQARKKRDAGAPQVTQAPAPDASQAEDLPNRLQAAVPSTAAGISSDGAEGASSSGAFSGVLPPEAESSRNGVAGASSGVAGASTIDAVSGVLLPEADSSRYGVAGVSSRGEDVGASSQLLEGALGLEGATAASSHPLDAAPRVVEGAAGARSHSYPSDGAPSRIDLAPAGTAEGGLAPPGTAEGGSSALDPSYSQEGVSGGGGIPQAAAAAALTEDRDQMAAGSSGTVSEQAAAGPGVGPGQLGAVQRGTYPSSRGQSREGQVGGAKMSMRHARSLTRASEHSTAPSYSRGAAADTSAPAAAQAAAPASVPAPASVRASEPASLQASAPASAPASAKPTLTPRMLVPSTPQLTTRSAPGLPPRLGSSFQLPKLSLSDSGEGEDPLQAPSEANLDMNSRPNRHTSAGPRSSLQRMMGTAPATPKEGVDWLLTQGRALKTIWSISGFLFLAVGIISWGGWYWFQWKNSAEQIKKAKEGVLAKEEVKARSAEEKAALAAFGKDDMKDPWAAFRALFDRDTSRNPAAVRKPNKNPAPAAAISSKPPAELADRSSTKPENGWWRSLQKVHYINFGAGLGLMPQLPLSEELYSLAKKGAFGGALDADSWMQVEGVGAPFLISFEDRADAEFVANTIKATMLEGNPDDDRLRRSLRHTVQSGSPVFLEDMARMQAMELQVVPCDKLPLDVRLTDAQMYVMMYEVLVCGALSTDLRQGAPSSPLPGSSETNPPQPSPAALDGASGASTSAPNAAAVGAALAPTPSSTRGASSDEGAAALGKSRSPTSSSRFFDFSGFEESTSTKRRKAKAPDSQAKPRRVARPSRQQQQEQELQQQQKQHEEQQKQQEQQQEQNLQSAVQQQEAVSKSEPVSPSSVTPVQQQDQNLRPTGQQRDPLSTSEPVTPSSVSPVQEALQNFDSKVESTPVAKAEASLAATPPTSNVESTPALETEALFTAPPPTSNTLDVVQPVVMENGSGSSSRYVSESNREVIPAEPLEESSTPTTTSSSSTTTSTSAKSSVVDERTRKLMDIASERDAMLSEWYDFNKLPTAEEEEDIWGEKLAGSSKKKLPSSSTEKEPTTEEEGLLREKPPGSSTEKLSTSSTEKLPSSYTSRVGSSSNMSDSRSRSSESKGSSNSSETGSRSDSTGSSNSSNGQSMNSNGNRADSGSGNGIESGSRNSSSSSSGVESSLSGSTVSSSETSPSGNGSSAPSFVTSKPGPSATGSLESSAVGSSESRASGSGSSKPAAAGTSETSAGSSESVEPSAATLRARERAKEEEDAYVQGVVDNLKTVQRKLDAIERQVNSVTSRPGVAGTPAAAAAKTQAEAQLRPLQFEVSRLQGLIDECEKDHAATIDAATTPAATASAKTSSTAAPLGGAGGPPTGTAASSATSSATKSAASSATSSATKSATNSGVPTSDPLPTPSVIKGVDEPKKRGWGSWSQKNLRIEQSGTTLLKPSASGGGPPAASATTAPPSSSAPAPCSKTTSPRPPPGKQSKEPETKPASTGTGAPAAEEAEKSDDGNTIVSKRVGTNRPKKRVIPPEEKQNAVKKALEMAASELNSNNERRNIDDSDSDDEEEADGSGKKTWWQERFQALWLPNLVYADGSLGFVQIDVSLKENKRDMRVLAFEDRHNASHCMAVMKCWPEYDWCDMSISFVPTPDLEKRLGDLFAEEGELNAKVNAPAGVVVFRKGKLPMRVGMRMDEFTNAIVAQAAAQRSLTSIGFDLNDL